MKRCPENASFFGHERSGVDNFTRDEEICSATGLDRAAEVFVRSFHIGEYEASQKELTALFRVHDIAPPLDRLRCFVRKVRTHGIKLEAESFELFPIHRARAEHRGMAARPGFEGHCDKRMQ